MQKRRTHIRNMEKNSSYKLNMMEVYIPLGGSRH